MSEAWKDDDLEPRALGRKAKAWLRRRIRATFFGDPDEEGCRLCGLDKVRWSEGVVDWFLDWYMERPDKYVRWVDADAWRGRGYSNGEWVFLDDRVTADARDAIDVIDQRIDNGRCDTLDEWLRRDLSGDLYFRGAAGGSRHIPEDLRNALKAKASARRRRTLRARICACGQQFEADRANARRCEKCRSLARAEREARRSGA